MATLEERVETLERRFSDLEGQVGFLIPLTRQLHREILSVQEKLREHDERFDKIDERFDKIDQRFGRVEQAVDALPRAVAEEIARRR